MPLFEALRLALAQIRVQKLKGFFTLLGVTIIRKATPIQASIQPIAVLAALGAAAFAGIVFGMLPAIRAASLDPVAALRLE